MIVVEPGQEAEVATRLGRFRSIRALRPERGSAACIPAAASLAERLAGNGDSTVFDRREPAATERLRGRGDLVGGLAAWRAHLAEPRADVGRRARLSDDQQR